MTEEEQESEDRFQLNEAADFVRLAKPGNQFVLDHHIVVCPSGAKVFQEGEIGEAMYIVLEGKVSIVKKLENGSSRVLATMGKGDFFGEMSLIDKKKRSATASCQTDTRLIKIPEGVLVQFIEKNPQFAIKMLNTFVGRLRNANMIIERAIVRNPTAVIFDGLKEYVRSRGMKSAMGYRVNISDFSAWANYQLGVPEEQVPRLLETLVERKVLARASSSEEVLWRTEISK
jgi:CRP-like cAMP-binding protein